MCRVEHRANYAAPLRVDVWRDPASVIPELARTSPVLVQQLLGFRVGQPRHSI
jgi:hypothetical protein